MKRTTIAILLGSVLVGTSALATTYVRVEKDGTKTYSDRPLPGGHPIEIEPAQTYSAPQPGTARDPTRTPEQQALQVAANFKYACALSPRNDETFQNPESVTLSVQLTPQLRPGDQVKFSMDGTELERGENSTSKVIELPDRGTHSAAVLITDRYGQSVCTANTTFHVLRTGLNSPARPTPARPRPRS